MREKAIDCFKGILTLQMVFAHSLQFYCTLQEGEIWFEISEYINLTTFSGFVFCFGYAAYYAYLKKDFQTAAKRIGGNILKILAAFYISSFSFVIFIERIPLRWDKIKEILFLERLAGWSEFLVAFAAILLICLGLHPLLRRIEERRGWIVLTAGAVLCVALCFRNYKEVTPAAGIFIGGYGSAYFPALPYFIYFLLGIYFAAKKIGFKIPAAVIAVGATTAYYLGFYYLDPMYTSRFPLSLLWLIGGLAYLYGYYLLSKWIGNRRGAAWLCFIGQNSMVYLLLSNIFLFSLKNTVFFKMSWNFALGYFAVLIVVITYFIVMGKNKVS